VYAKELKITNIVKNNNNSYNIVLNNAISINNILLKNKNDTNFVEFSVYVKNRKIYKRLSFLTREYGNYIASSIARNEVYKFEGQTSFKINKFSKVKKEGNIKAFASVIFEDLLEAECRIMKGKNGLWVAWPADKTADGWKAELSFTDKSLKKRIDDALILKYNKEDE
jgi:DNA-binding cell septation regulator SpoVG